jgi:hypothetical protein
MWMLSASGILAAQIILGTKDAKNQTDDRQLRFSSGNGFLHRLVIFIRMGGSAGHLQSKGRRRSDWSGNSHPHEKTAALTDCRFSNCDGSEPTRKEIRFPSSRRP